MTMPSTEPTTAPQQMPLLELPPPPEPSSPSKPTACAAAVGKAMGGARRYQRGVFDPHQEMLLPPRVEDFVDANNPVRAIAVYVEACDLAALDFKHATGGGGRGQPAYDPRDMLKLYLYGYMNRVRSSRRLEVECRRNLELIWLLGGLRPNYHSIADFRRDNAKALKALNREFVQLCRGLALIDGERVGVDGSFFKASASAASVKTLTQLKRELAALEREIDAYHAEIEANDATETDSADPVSFDAEQLEALKAQVAETQATIKTLEEHGETQLSHTDPDARRLRKNGKSVVGYNVQISVDDQHKLILDAELTNAGNDQGQLAGAVERCGEALGGNVAQRASAATEAAAPASPTVSGESSRAPEAPGAGAATSEDRYQAPSSAPAEPSQAANAQAPVVASATADQAPTDPEALPAAPVYVADSGYYTDADIAACAAQGVVIYVPIPNKASRAEADGRFPGGDFRYEAEADGYRCPNDCELRPRGQPTLKNGNLRQTYVSRAEDCDGCPLREQCLPQKSNTRKLYRSEHADAVERHRQHMATDEAKAEIAHRGALCEHPFGILKRWMGWDHFLVRGLEKAGGELGLLTHCYNLKRVLNILGVAGFIECCQQLRAAAAT